MTGTEAVACYFEMWNTGDGSVAHEILDPEWVDHAHPEVVGPSDVAAAVDRLHVTRPGLRFRIDECVSSGSLVVAVGEVGGPGVPVTGLVWLFRTAGDRLGELWTYPVRPERR